MFIRTQFGTTVTTTTQSVVTVMPSNIVSLAVTITEGREILAAASTAIPSPTKNNGTKLLRRSSQRGRC